MRSRSPVMRVVQMHDQRAQRQLLLAAFGGMDLTDKRWAVLEPIFRQRRRPDGRGPLDGAAGGPQGRPLGLAHGRSVVRSAAPLSAGSDLPSSLSAVATIRTP